MTAAGYVLMCTGSFFYILGGLGMLRMPDVFNRLQAGTKATTLGSISFILGAGLLNPDFFFKSIVIIIFIMITNPIGSSVIARAAFRKGVDFDKKSIFLPKRDDIDERF